MGAGLTRRTDRKVAEDSVGIIRSILDRKAWLQEIES
jgi:hypothetical protein